MVHGDTSAVPKGRAAAGRGAVKALAAVCLQLGGKGCGIVSRGPRSVIVRSRLGQSAAIGRQSAPSRDNNISAPMPLVDLPIVRAILQYHHARSADIGFVSNCVTPSPTA
ncbi:hypothetical protein [Sphingobium cupriresistens]|uniref:Uncharacterized protein n=1 Tax=Sphingobium cupriresistens TaxID=1132417 RepID=A0A8G1ZD19_9SPHN|nr:hypothetical protein [Sphingobium cupriresistens]RYM07538.1 hypothetical protein EWH12_18905 [Sphingobium cupriresistens]